MQLWTAYLILGLSFFGDATASEGAHHGHVSDLLAPIVNVVILAGFLVWKLRNPLREYFKKQALEITNTLERASLKSKEAEVMLYAQEKKMANIDFEMKEIMRGTDNEIKHFEKQYAREIDDKSFKLKTDATLKIEAERKAITEELHATLLDAVIRKTKETIKGNKDYQAKASAKMLGGAMQ